MIPINPIRPTTDRQQIIRNPHPLGQPTRQIPRKQRNALLDIRLKRITNSTNPPLPSPPILFWPDFVVLLEDELARAVDGYEAPGGEVGVWRELDAFGPFVAEC